MFIHKETGRPAWLLQQDGDVLYSTVDPADPEHMRHHQGATSFEFFSTYREATADELAGDVKPGAGVVSMPMHQGAPARPISVTPGGLAEPKGFAGDPPARPAKPKAAKPAAKKKPAAAKKAASKAAAKPAADPKDAKAADKPAPATNSPPADKPAASGEGAAPPPAHGEQGRD